MGLRTLLGFCLLAAVVGGPTVDLPRAQVAVAAAEIPRPAQGPTSLPQTITFDQPPDTAADQPVTLSAATDADGSLVVSGVTHTVHIESSPGASIATIKEARR